MKSWHPQTWRLKRVLQQPEYPNTKQLEEVLAVLRLRPPIVFPGEVERLKGKIADAAHGDSFILQGGDCVERFEDCTERRIVNKIKILLQMSVILTYAARKPVVKIGRIAGQYFKPRSRPTEMVGEVELNSYRGDGINDITASVEGREADPQRLISSYFSATSTLNCIRAMISGGFADLHNPYNWNLYSIEQTENWKDYREIVEHIIDAVTFMETFGGINSDSVGNIDFFTSHEGLHLGFEEALTRQDPSTGNYYNLGAHMLWIGERTRCIDDGHVEYFRGISNPIGIKIGHAISPDELLRLIETLNPKHVAGKITLISRLGIENVEKALPALIRRVAESGATVAWCCDPMHGNTVNARNGLKTRRFDDVLRELAATFEIHRDCGSILSGVHFELTGEDVTECTGGALRINDGDLDKNYQTYCDPRLNYTQSMEMSFLISRYLKIGL